MGVFCGTLLASLLNFSKSKKRYLSFSVHSIVMRPSLRESTLKAFLSSKKGALLFFWYFDTKKSCLDTLLRDHICELQNEFTLKSLIL